MKKYYITTTLPYVNADPHIGFALEIIQADVLARYHALLGEDVVFNTGTDEHGIKIFRKAEEMGMDPQSYTDLYAAKFDALKQSLNLSYTNFIRTTNPDHKKAAQEFWQLCLANGDIYKKQYQVKYCVGCELEKTDSELIDGACPVHPKMAIEHISEENYFFKFSAYQQPLLDLYEKNPDFVVPQNRLTEIKNFVAGGLQDFSISRLKEKMPWGVPVPNDETQVMYVWFDALCNYISTLGWPKDGVNFAACWPGVQVAGKDNLRQQSAMWQAMLMSAKLPPSKQIFIHGFITSEGQKMSKSLGNVINPLDIVETYGTDPVRFYLLGALSSYEDGDYSTARFEEYYTAHLANGIGNLTARTLTMVEKFGENTIADHAEDCFDIAARWNKYESALSMYNFEEAIKVVNELVKACDEKISLEKPWEKVKLGEDVSPLIYQLAETLRHLALMLLPILPTAAEKILTQMNIPLHTLKTLDLEKKWGGLKKGDTIAKADPLFPRLIK